jgi:hypothetical protein
MSWRAVVVRGCLEWGLLIAGDMMAMTMLMRAARLLTMRLFLLVYWAPGSIS